MVRSVNNIKGCIFLEQLKHNQLFKIKSRFVDLTYNQVTSKYTVIQSITDVTVNQSYTKRHSTMGYTVSTDVTG
jgi:hypothetical protein